MCLSVRLRSPESLGDLKSQGPAPLSQVEETWPGGRSRQTLGYSQSPEPKSSWLFFKKERDIVGSKHRETVREAWLTGAWTPSLGWLLCALAPLSDSTCLLRQLQGKPGEKENQVFVSQQTWKGLQQVSWQYPESLPAAGLIASATPLRSVDTGLLVTCHSRATSRVRTSDRQPSPHRPS